MKHAHKFNSIDNILNTKVTRREFLIYLGTFFITIIGITNISKQLSKGISTLNIKSNTKFGTGPYGGRKEII